MKRAHPEVGSKELPFGQSLEGGMRSLQVERDGEGCPGGGNRPGALE